MLAVSTDIKGKDEQITDNLMVQKSNNVTWNDAMPEVTDLRHLKRRKVCSLIHS